MRLYWFLESQYLQRFFSDGQMYFGRCSRYDDDRLTTAQRDSEGKRAAQFSSTEIRISTGDTPANAIAVPFTSVEFACALPCYFLRSFAREGRRSTAKIFRANSCIEFFDIPLLIAELKDAVSKQLNTGKWRMVHKEVRYVTKHELIGIVDPIDRIFAKDRNKYRNQSEFRVALLPEHNYPGASDSHLFLYLSDVSRFARHSF